MLKKLRFVNFSTKNDVNNLNLSKLKFCNIDINQITFPGIDLCFQYLGFLLLGHYYEYVLFLPTNPAPTADIGVLWSGSRGYLIPDTAVVISLYTTYSATE